MDTLIVALAFILNNILWMYFAYILLPRESKKEIKLKFPEMPFMKKEAVPEDVNPDDLVDLDAVDLKTVREAFEKKAKEDRKGK